MRRDPGNPTYDHTLDTLCSESGYRFQREKYAPILEYLRSRFGDRFADVRLLDVGVGYGIFLRIAAEDFGMRHLFGMDPYPQSIEVARTQTGAPIARGDILDDRWPYDEGSFDVITCFDVLEHLERPAEFLVKARRYLRPGGLVVVRTPNKELPYRLRSVPLIGFPDNNPTHINIQPPSYWRRLALENGFEVVASWKGEHLTHVRAITKVMTAVCRVFRIDHRKIPVVNSFEQAFILLARPVDRKDSK